MDEACKDRSRKILDLGGSDSDSNANYNQKEFSSELWGICT